MRRKFLKPTRLAPAVAAAALLLGACKAGDTTASMTANTAPPKSSNSASAPVGTTTVDADSIRRVNVAELQKMVEEGRVAIYDTRSKASYEQEHIRGALPLPQNEAEARAGELPRDKTLVFYCT